MSPVPIESDNLKAEPVSQLSEPQECLSPSLSSREVGAKAYEVKFLIDEQQASQVESWSLEHLQRDPHCNPLSGGAYRIASIYTDTASFDVYHRTPKFRRRKYRLRRYGNESMIHLERKVRRGEQVSKRRTTIPQADSEILSNPLLIADWEGHWFHESLLRKALHPVCQIVYDRTAFLGQCADGPLRLTMDRKIRGLMSTDWTLGNFESAHTLADERVVLELKFRDAMPSLFKQLVTNLQLTPTGFSKYRHCINTWQSPSEFANGGLQYA